MCLLTRIFGPSLNLMLLVDYILRAYLWLFTDKRSHQNTYFGYRGKEVRLLEFVNNRNQFVKE